MSVKSILIALALVGAPSAAAAQHAEHPDTPTAAEIVTQPGEGHGAHGAGHHADPSKYFNWFDGADLSYKNKDQYGGPLGDGKVGPEARPGDEAPMSVPFILVLINFGILLILIGWKVAPMANRAAANRSDDIKTALDEAAKLRAQAQTKLEEYSTKLKAAEDEMAQMIDGMRKDAEAEKARIIAAAEAQARALEKDAEERIAAEIVRARAELQREVVIAAAGVAEQLLRARTTPADQAKLVDTFLADVGKAAAAAKEIR